MIARLIVLERTVRLAFLHKPFIDSFNHLVGKVQFIAKVEMMRPHVVEKMWSL